MAIPAAAIATIAVLAVLGVMLVTVLASPASPGGQSYRWTCRLASMGEPQVRITNMSGQPLRVGWVNIAVFSESGAQVGSMNLFAPTASFSVAPGSSLVLTGHPDTKSGGTSCRVESLNS